jgi:hypothetical protein
MRYDNRKWVIITLADYSDNELQVFVDNAIQTSVDTLMKSIDGTKAMLKWDGDTPSCFDGMTTYSHAEIRAELRTSTWFVDD